MDRTYFVVDGSCLFSAIKELQKRNTSFEDKKLHIERFKDALMNRWSRYIGSVIRVIFYFRKNDLRIKNVLHVPNSTVPGAKSHWQIKECGESLATIPESELEKLSEKYRSYYPRAEKGLDIKLVCDVLQLVATDKANNIVLYVNDSDYVPLFETLQNLGVNVYLSGLDSNKKINKKLADLSDVYLTLDNDLESLFV